MYIQFEDFFFQASYDPTNVSVPALLLPFSPTGFSFNLPRIDGSGREKPIFPYFSFRYSHSLLTSRMRSLILTSDGWMMCPVSLTLPCTTSASSGRSVLMPTLPVCTIDSGAAPRCQHSSASLSNWPGFDACATTRGKKPKKKTKNPYVANRVARRFERRPRPQQCLLVYRNYLDYPDNYPLGRVWDDRIVVIVDAVRVQPDHQVKVPLVRVRFALLPHVVARRLAEVQPAHGHLGHLFVVQVQSETIGGKTVFPRAVKNIVFVKHKTEPRTKESGSRTGTETELR